MLLAASFVHAAFGFGTALVAQPLLVIQLGLATATPLVGLSALTTVIATLAREHRALAWRPAARLLLASLAGLPLGLWLLHHAPVALMQRVLGAVLVAYCAFVLSGRRVPALALPGTVYGFGFVAGIFGGAFNINAPPVVIYGALSRWSPAQFRAVLQAFFLPSALFICGGHALSGLWTTRVGELFACALPAIAIGNVLGVVVARRIPVRRFEHALYLLLTVLGAALLFY